MTTALHFRCTGCGACCDTAPEIRLGESLALADAFVLRLTYARSSFARPGRERAREGAMRGAARAIPSYAAGDALDVAVAMRDHFRAQPDFVLAEGLAHADDEEHLFPAVRPLGAALASRCPQLGGDGRCGIYDRRPSICRTVPAAWSTPDALAADHVRAFTQRPGYRCDTSADAPVMFDGGTLVSLEYRRERERAASVTGAAERRLAETLVHAGDDGVPLLPTTAELVRLTAGGKQLVLPWAATLMPAVATGVATEEAAARGAAGQVEAIRSARAANDAERGRLAAEIRRAGFVPERFELGASFRARFERDPDGATAAAREAADLVRQREERRALDGTMEELLRATLPYVRTGFMARWRRPNGAARAAR